MDDLSSWVAFAQLHCLALSQKHALLHKFKSVNAIFELNPGELNLDIKPKKRQFRDYIDQKQCDQTLNWLHSQPNHHIVTFFNEQYPYLLRQISRSPLLLYLKGNPQLLLNNQIAIVGSRKSTIAGKQTAAQFAGELVMSGLTITSGMAIGIDSAAHAGALQHYGHTIAVLGTGVDQCYPRSNQALYSQIMEKGLLISEFSLGSPPKREHFPRRNRLISGLSLGVVVIEAATRSGSLITANYAVQQNREVFAIPGSIYSKSSAGCLSLIQQGAKLTRCLNDILEEFSEFSGLSIDNTKKNTNTQKIPPNDERNKILELIDDSPVTFDKLMSLSGLTIDQLCSMLLDLELNSMIEKLPGNQFIRTAKQ